LDMVVAASLQGSVHVLMNAPRVAFSRDL